jgi:hypothetical protein
MRIEPIEKDAAPPDVLRIYAALEKAQGEVSNFHKMLAHRPETPRLQPSEWSPVGGGRAAAICSSVSPRRFAEAECARVQYPQPLRTEARR